MFDARLRPVIEPHLARAAQWCHRKNISANQLTFAALGLTVLVILAISFGYFFLALILIFGNRSLDGIDGPLARLSHPPTPENPGGGTDFGGFLDIVSDFIFYASVPLAFVWFDHIENGNAASFLLFTFIGSGVSFLAFAAIAAKRNLTTTSQGHKSIFYLGGLMEGAETIGFFVLMCLFAPFFDVLAYTFGTLCLISTAGRIFMAKNYLS